MAELWAGLFIFLLFLTLLLHPFSLPGNWLLLAFMLVWKWFHPEMSQGWGFFLLLGGLAAVGEVIQFLTQAVGVKRYGGSRRGNWWSIFGSIIGAVLGAPIGFGLGAIPGAFLGAYAGGLAAERTLNRPWKEAHRSAMGALFGNVLGIVAKFGIGVFMFWLSVPAVWPG
ncbi:DUF456 domain-containing protein [Desulfohalovibrio reitneri]|uniref:DUF456 domain-containing protein n=1 Tax=Desulfohalovibrio reitneri TaxID=1307759 RepID=UPI0004A6DA3C|nr:DUF456 domain-containing protein [Desulfohalovibrio reitneri]